MDQNELIKFVKERAEKWLKGNIDADTKKEVQQLLDNDQTGLIDAFYRDLEFGTAGLRGIMGAGTNRMNKYTVGMATQGLANYLKINFKSLSEIKVVIAHDCRNNGRMFSETAAKIFAANGIKALLFESLRPTPELSFATRYYGCQAGIVLTASHNPKEYNGYKVFWEDGAQIIDPHDANIIDEVNKITDVDMVKWDGTANLIQSIGKEVDEVYLDKVKTLSLSPDAVQKYHDIKIVYTPIHGTGVHLIPASLKRYGFTQIYNIPEQDITDGNFPTVKSPNPENAEALSMAVKKAKETDADLVMASDPDADRVGIAVKNDKGEWILLNGNQTGAILVYYLITRWKETNKITGKEFVVKTIVTTDLITEIAHKNGVESFECLTGFKYIADVIRKNEGIKQFIGGGEESYGYLAGDFVRDKDAVIACSLIAECAAWAKSRGKSMFDILLELYEKYGFYKEGVVNIDKKGKSGAEEILQMMADYRANPLKEIAGSKVVTMKDLKSMELLDVVSGKKSKIDLPSSNVLQFITESGTKISVRPSGTEPKIKFYFSVKVPLKSAKEFHETEKIADKQIEAIITSLGLK